MRPPIALWPRLHGLDAAMQRFLDPHTGDGTVDLLRRAAQGAAEARTHAELSAAGADLGGAMQRVGLHHWPRYLADAADRAGAAPTPDQIAQLNGSGAQAGVANGVNAGNQATPYVGSNPRQWIGQPPVGSGECVPLVQRATGAPRTSEWRRRTGTGQFTIQIASASGIECPRSSGGKHLTEIDVYDGPISRMASLMPGDGGWNLDYSSVSGEGFYLACHYGDKIVAILFAEGGEKLPRRRKRTRCLPLAGRGIERTFS